MRQLLEIESIPIKLEVKVTHPRWKRSDDFDSQSVSAYNNRVGANSATGSVNSPATGAVKSGNVSERRSPYSPSDVYAGGPEQVSFDRVRAYDSAAAILRNPSAKGTPETGFVQAGLQNTMISAVANDFVHRPVRPLTSGSDYAGNAGHVKSYESERASFDARQGLVRAEYEFIPGNIEYTVTQRNEVRFTYTGTPIYVPRSADPDYEESEYL